MRAKIGKKNAPFFLSGRLFHLTLLVLIVFFLFPSGHRSTGVVIWNKQRAWDGDNVMEVILSGCALMDMKGDVIHRLPGTLCLFSERHGLVSAFHPKDPGPIPAAGAPISRKGFLFKNHLGAESIWETSFWIHHDLQESPLDDSLWFIATSIEALDRNKAFGLPVDEEIVSISPQGEVLFRWRTLDHLAELQALSSGKKIKSFPYQQSALEFKESASEDVAYTQSPFVFQLQKPKFYNPIFGTLTHLNSLQVLPENLLSDIDPAFRAGNILVSDAEGSRIFILERKSGKIVWWHIAKGTQHTARFLDNGRILFFQNGISFETEEQQVSEVVEIDPITHQRVWSYTETPREKMFCDRFGSAQRLPNGNTLISYGCGDFVALEVTPGKEIVWKWLRPNTVLEKKIFGQDLYRVWRISKELRNKSIRDITRDSSKEISFTPEELSISLDLAGLALTKKTEEEHASQKTRMFDFVAGNSRLELKEILAIQEAEAGKRASDRIFSLQGLFAPQVSPYPDRISNVIACGNPPEFETGAIPDGWIRSAYLWANDRFTYGSCEKKEQAYHSVNALIYCKKSKTYVEIRYFLKNEGHSREGKASLQKLVASIQCR